MSRILALPVRRPIKATIRTKDQIREFVVNAEKSAETSGQTHVRIKSMQVLGLIPPDFDFEAFEIKVLTEEIAGLYDPKSKEFFVAADVPEERRKVVMAHELTHALQDQNFQLDDWMHAGKTYDGMIARDAVGEGSAMMAMIDYAIRSVNLSVRDLADISRYIRPRMPAGGENLQLWLKTPPFLHDEFLFVYLTGGVFSQRVLQAHTGWIDFKTAFENPPASSSQVMHPDLYFKKVAPKSVELPAAKEFLSDEWQKLDENVLGELRLRGMLTKYVGWVTAGNAASTWDGDRYQIWENQKDKRTLLIYRQDFSDTAGTSNFFSTYSQALDTKYPDHSDEQTQPLAYSFHTGAGDVSLHCEATHCLLIEGADHSFAQHYLSKLSAPPAPPVGENHPSHVR